MSGQPNIHRAGSDLRGPSGMLEFEKPLARLEREVAELEHVQAQTGRDLSAEI